MLVQSWSATRVRMSLPLQAPATSPATPGTPPLRRAVPRQQFSAVEGRDRGRLDALAAIGNARPLTGRRIALTSRPDALGLDPDVAEGSNRRVLP